MSQSSLSRAAVAVESEQKKESSVSLKSYESTDLRAYLVKYLCRVRALSFGIRPRAGKWTYMRNEFVPLFLAQQFLQVIQEGETFLIWNAGEGIIRVLAFEVDDKFGKFMVFTKLGYRVRECFPANDSGKVSVRFSMSIDC